MSNDWRKPLFYIAALYDGLLGLLFLFLWRDVFAHFNITPPNHPGYAQFPALLLIIFGLLFLQIARNPAANRDLIVYGILLKIAYSGTVFWHHFTGGVPSMWIWCAWADVAFLVLFVVAWRKQT